MLKPSSDRLDYGELLAPPTGCELTVAIGTTYSLDFDALIGVCLALGLSQSTESAFLNNPVYLLETLRRTGDKLALFCQSGQILVPSNNSPLYILLEKIVYEVQVKKQKAAPQYPSFHPKFWLTKYVDADGSSLYRVIILSRNLTFDRSWDLAVALEGRQTKKACKKTKPIIDFLDYLYNELRGSGDKIREKRKMLRDLMQELRTVEFCTESREYSDFDFIPVGIPKDGAGRYSIEEYPLFNDTFHEILIMSPFLTGSVIEEFNTRNKNIEAPNCTLLTRRASLSQLKPSQCDKFDIYTMKDAVVEGETALSDDNENPKKQDIHAKLYMHRKYSDSELYLGSLNASHSAMHGNVEFMLRLVSKNRWLNTEIMLKDFFGGAADNPSNPFELTALPDKPEELPDSSGIWEQKIKLLCRSNPKASVREDGDKYAIDMEFGNITDTEGITVAPLLSNKQAQLSAAVTFEGLSLLQISEFYRITAGNIPDSVQRVVKIPTANIPKNRDSAVITDAVKDKQGFYQYVSFLLGDNYLLSVLENATLQRSGLAGSSSTVAPALYERMLRTAVTAPERFAEIDYLIKMISADNVIPEGFEALYTAFKKAVNTRG
jgi:hypothetical protein